MEMVSALRFDVMEEEKELDSFTSFSLKMYLMDVSGLKLTETSVGRDSKMFACKGFPYFCERLVHFIVLLFEHLFVDFSISRKNLISYLAQLALLDVIWFSKMI